MMVYGEESAAAFLRQWLADKSDVILMTGRASYERCGAESFFAPYLASKRYCRMTTVGENARKEDVDAKVAAILSNVSPEECQHLCFIAVGGGTVIDTTKLVRDAVNSAAPFLAVPTTAGTGAETTRFAVYYDHGKKMSADDVRYLPTDVILIPAFAATQTPYQRASTEFDAYAQAVESFWANGATDESRGYARKALDLMASGKQMLGAYWAGKAIDISRTTAAHALSYYLTANYGIPHGHAVYMVFPYVCRANGHPEFEKVVTELQTLREFSAERGLVWSDLVGALISNVNPKRLANNPAPITTSAFGVSDS